MDILMPQFGGMVASGIITSWLKKVGDKVEKNEPLIEVTTDKVDTEVMAPCAGVLTEIFYGLGETIDVGVKLAKLKVEGEAESTCEEVPTGKSREAIVAEASCNAKMPLSPAVRRLIAEYNLDPSTILGTGRNGRITRTDVIAYLAGGQGHNAGYPSRSGR
ncbi:MAG: biotin/lipoyl-containing protein [Halopseudomonas sp.]